MNKLAIETKAGRGRGRGREKNMHGGAH